MLRDAAMSVVLDIVGLDAVGFVETPKPLGLEIGDTENASTVFEMRTFASSTRPIRRFREVRASPRKTKKVGNQRAIAFSFPSPDLFRFLRRGEMVASIMVLSAFIPAL